MDLKGLARGLLRPIGMKIAVSHWHGRIAPVFDVSDNLLLIDIEGGLAVHQENIRLADRDSFGRAREVAALGVQVLLCGAVSHALETALIGAGVKVSGFLCGDLEAVIDAYLKDRLKDARFVMPGHRVKKPPSGTRRRQVRRSDSTPTQLSTDKQKGGIR